MTLLAKADDAFVGELFAKSSSADDFSRLVSLAKSSIEMVGAKRATACISRRVDCADLVDQHRYRV
jgi:hypothetical protein